MRKPVYHILLKTGISGIYNNFISVIELKLARLLRIISRKKYIHVLIYDITNTPLCSLELRLTGLGEVASLPQNICFPLLVVPFYHSTFFQVHQVKFLPSEITIVM